MNHLFFLVPTCLIGWTWQTVVSHISIPSKGNTLTLAPPCKMTVWIVCVSYYLYIPPASAVMYWWRRLKKGLFTPTHIEVKSVQSTFETSERKQTTSWVKCESSGHQDLRVHKNVHTHTHTHPYCTVSYMNTHFMSSFFPLSGAGTESGVSAWMIN